MMETIIMKFNKTIQMLIFGRELSGLIMCELDNWNGRVYKTSRADLTNLSKREDSSHTGVYFLFGKDEDNRDVVYIGEGEDVYMRLTQQLKVKDYWYECIVLIAKDNHLNKAHVKFLENKFYELAIASTRAVVKNDKKPTPSTVSEFDEDMLYAFIENAKLLVNALGYKVFDVLDDNFSSSDEKPRFKIERKNSVNAQGYVVADGFQVLKGSMIAKTVQSSCRASNLYMRDKLLADGTIDSNYTFTKDYVFSSPSAASVMVLGMSSNGRKEWKTKEGTTIAVHEEKLSKK